MKAIALLILIVPAFLLGCDQSPIEKVPMKGVTKIADIPLGPDVYRIDDDERGYTLYVVTKSGNGGGTGVTAVPRIKAEKR